MNLTCPLLHLPLPPDLCRLDDQWQVRLRIAPELAIHEVLLRIDPNNQEELLLMAEEESEGQWRCFRSPLPLDGGNPTSHYCFKVILADGRQRWLDARGLWPRMPTRDTHFKLCPGHQPPLWVRDQLFCQIFPDRFCNGDEALSPHSGDYQLRGDGPIQRQPWGSPPPTNFTQGHFYGGDLIGVRQQLDYLQQLGITALYLNPVFASPSNHGYDTEDYFQVAPRFGGNQALADLCQALHQRGMKIMLDAVFNHVSDTHPWFNRWGTQPNQDGAAQTVDSPYRHYFTWNADGEAETWLGVGTIPVLDLGLKELQDYFWSGDGSVARHYLRAPYQIDGWRVDVIHMMGHGPGAAHNLELIASFREAVKDERGDAYFVGEHFFEASRWLQGPHEDGAMNYYGFSHPVRAFLAGLDVAYHPCAIDAAEFDDWLNDARARIPYANALAQFNALDTHDTRRFLTMVGGDKGKLTLALLLLMTYPGVPCLYYGTEIGLGGGDDPDNRRCMEWDEARWDQSLLATSRSLIALHHEQQPLRHGGYLSLHAAGDLFAFARMVDDQWLVIAINRGSTAASLSSAHPALPAGQWQRLWGEGERVDGTLQLGPCSGTVWRL